MKALVLGLPDAVADRLAASGFEVETIPGADRVGSEVASGEVTVVIAPAGAGVGEVLARCRPYHRRRVVHLEIDPGVKTGDGVAAFSRSVDAVVSQDDLERIGAVAVAAVERHRELASAIEPELAG